MSSITNTNSSLKRSNADPVLPTASASKVKRVKFSEDTNKLNTLAMVSSSAHHSSLSVAAFEASDKWPLLNVTILPKKVPVAAIPLVTSDQQLHKTVAKMTVQSKKNLNLCQGLLADQIAADPKLKPMTNLTVRENGNSRVIEFEWETKLHGGEQLWLHSGRIQSIVRECFGVSSKAVSSLEIENSCGFKMNFGADIPTIKGARSFTFNPQTGATPSFFKKSIETIMGK